MSNYIYEDKYVLTPEIIFTDINQEPVKLKEDGTYDLSQITEFTFSEMPGTAVSPSEITLLFNWVNFYKYGSVYDDDFLNIVVVTASVEAQSGGGNTYIGGYEFSFSGDTGEYSASQVIRIESLRNPIKMTVTISIDDNSSYIYEAIFTA